MVKLRRSFAVDVILLGLVASVHAQLAPPRRGLPRPVPLPKAKVGPPARTYMAVTAKLRATYTSQTAYGKRSDTPLRSLDLASVNSAGEFQGRQEKPYGSAGTK